MSAKEKETHSEAREILDKQRLLHEAREKLSRFLDKNIFIISGDFSIRETTRSHLETLGFSSDKIRRSNTSADLISNLQEDPESVDLVICHLKTLDSRVSPQKGSEVLKLVKDRLEALGSTREIPFIFIEKKFVKKDIVEGFKRGASDFIVFPADPISIGNKVAQAFEAPVESAISRDIATLLLRGNRLQEQGLFDQAIHVYNKVLKMGGDNVEVLTEKANTLLKMGDIDQAIQVYKYVTEIEENFPRAYQGLGEAYAQVGNFTEAKKHYRKVLDLEPQNILVLYSIGTIFQDEGDYETAKSYFENGMKVNKRFVKNYLGLAKTYERMGKPLKALAVYKEAIRGIPQQTFLYVTAGDFCLKYDLNQEAEEIFDEAINLNETQIHLYNKMGIALRKQKKFDAAISNFNRAVKIEPHDANLRYNLAKAHFLKGDEITAIQKLKKALELSPDLKAKFAQDVSFSKLLEKHPDEFSFL